MQDALLAAAEASSDRSALVAGDHELSYGGLFDRASRLARGLQELGLERGARVVIQMENSWQCATSIYGVLLAGGVFVVVNAQTKSDKLGFLLGDSEASFLLTDEHLVPNLAAVGRELPELQAVVCTGSPTTVPGWPLVSWEELVTRCEPRPAASRAIPVDLASLIYTSGSTRDPKGVMMTHQSMVFTTQSVSEYLRLGRDDRILNVLPLAFDYGLYQLLMAAELEASVVLERSFSFPAKVIERVAELEVTVFPGVPTIFARLLAQASESALVLPSVRTVTNTAAALPPDRVSGLRKIFPNALVFLMYGLTECKRVSYLEPELSDRKARSVGKAIPGTEAFVLLDDGRPAGPGETGILYVRGPHVMAGYWRQPELSADLLRPGSVPGERVLCTQDRFKTDDEGFLYFVGRSDDIIKSAGQKVNPLEVEDALYAIPGVREAAVVGVPDTVLGEAIHAYVACDDETLTEAAIRRACRARLEGFMVPRRVSILDTLPKTSSGKIRRASLGAEPSA